MVCWPHWSYCRPSRCLIVSLSSQRIFKTWLPGQGKVSTLGQIRGSSCGSPSSGPGGMGLLLSPSGAAAFSSLQALHPFHLALFGTSAMQGIVPHGHSPASLCLHILFSLQVGHWLCSLVHNLITDIPPFDLPKCLDCLAFVAGFTLHPSLSSAVQ